MKNYLVWLVLIFLLPTNSYSQLISDPLSDKETKKLRKGFQSKQFFKGLYNDFLKYGTVYGAGDINNSIEADEFTYFVRTNPDGGLYDIPTVVNNTPDYPFDYRVGFGIRKLARFGYERKPNNFWTGNSFRESQQALSAPTSAVDGFEYLFRFEKERQHV